MLGSGTHSYSRMRGPWPATVGPCLTDRQAPALRQAEQQLTGAVERLEGLRVGDKRPMHVYYDDRRFIFPTGQVEARLQGAMEQLEGLQRRICRLKWLLPLVRSICSRRNADIVQQTPAGGGAAGGRDGVTNDLSSNCNMSIARKNPKFDFFFGQVEAQLEGAMEQLEGLRADMDKKKVVSRRVKALRAEIAAQVPFMVSLVAQASTGSSTFESTIWTAAPAAHGAPRQDASCSPGAGLARFSMRQNAMLCICRRPGP